MKIFDYIFYRVYSFYRDKDSNPEIYASGIVTLIQFGLLLTLYLIIGLLIDIYQITNKYYVIPIIIGLIAYNWIKYEQTDKSKIFEELWKNEIRNKKNKRGWLILTIVLFSILTPIIIIVLKHNF